MQLEGAKHDRIDLSSENYGTVLSTVILLHSYNPHALFLKSFAREIKIMQIVQSRRDPTSSLPDLQTGKREVFNLQPIT